MSQRLQHARAAAEALGFAMASDDATRQLLAVLVTAVPVGGRVLELGTGTRVGLAAMVDALEPRTDVDVVSVELDARLAAAAAANDWPTCVDPRVGDAVALLAQRGGMRAGLGQRADPVCAPPT